MKDSELKEIKVSGNDIDFDRMPQWERKRAVNVFLRMILDWRKSKEGATVCGLN